MTFRRTQAGLFFLLFFSAGYFLHVVEYDNSSSRFFLLSAAVDFGRLDIDMYKSETIDVSVAGGRTYSNKAIGAPLVAAPVYGFLRKFTPIRKDRPLSQRAQYFTRLLTTTLLHALVGVAMFRFLLAVGARPAHAYLMVLAYAFGTIAWIHATMFSGHQMAAAFAFLSFSSVWSFARADRAGPAGFGRWFGAGILAGLGALCDYTAIFLAVLLAVYAWAKSRRPAECPAFLFGGAVTALTLFAYNNHCFGGPLSFSYAHLGYGEFAQGARRGILGVSVPDLGAFLSLILSPARGTFFIMPVLLMSIPGCWIWAMRTQTKSKRGISPETATVAAVVIGYLIINAGFYGWHGGWTFGPRYLVPILPFLALPMAFALDRIWFAPLAIFSFAQVAFAQVAVPHTPEYFSNPIVECVYPLFRYGYVADNAGLRLGLAWLPSILLFLAVVLFVAWVCRPKYPPPQQLRDGMEEVRTAWRPVYALACIAVLAGIGVVRTPPMQISLHELNSRLLGNLAYELSSEKLARAAYKEEQIARRSGRLSASASGVGRAPGAGASDAGR